ncbi:MAG: hypothetical protein JW751_27810 [Polyangiaceae bacterium]|nr:hypothetical protein [Polyangiaceae bacterium]
MTQPTEPAAETRSRDTILGFNKNIFYVGLVSFLTDTSTKMVCSMTSRAGTTCCSGSSFSLPWATRPMPS